MTIDATRSDLDLSIDEAIACLLRHARKLVDLANAIDIERGMLGQATMSDEIRRRLDDINNTFTIGGHSVMTQSAVDEALNTLGMDAEDRVTGFTGMVSSVSFDAYGCIQVVLQPRVQDGKMEDGRWFDIKRLKLGDRVLQAPPFVARKFGEENGASEKPAMSQQPVPR